MAVGRRSPIPEVKDLLLPPRTVPLWLWCHLLARPLTVVGSPGFALGMMVAPTFVRPTDPVGTWRLSQRHEEAPGWVDAREATRFSAGGDDDDGDTVLYRYNYSFRLPDGTRVPGSCYGGGKQLPQPAEAPLPGRPGPPVRVTVEYDPQDPGRSRIRGMRTSPYPSEALFVLLLPAAGLAVALGGLVVGRRRGRLLRDGHAATATITGCETGREDSKLVSPAAYKKDVGFGRWFGRKSGPSSRVSCTFEFRLPDGKAVQAKGPGRLVERKGAEPPQAALYDTRRPGRALLVSSLWPGVRAGAGGGWESSAGPETAVRLVIALLLVVAPLIAWALLW
jgi:hypothetical protein